jgi:hypothetical protein
VSDYLERPLNMPEYPSHRAPAVSEYGHTVIVRQVDGTVIMGSLAANGREVLTPGEVRELAVYMLFLADSAERWKPPESVQAKRVRLKREREAAAV